MAGAGAGSRRRGRRYCARSSAVRAGTRGGSAAQWGRDAGAPGRGCAPVPAAAACRCHRRCHRRRCHLRSRAAPAARATSPAVRVGRARLLLPPPRSAAPGPTSEEGGRSGGPRGRVGACAVRAGCPGARSPTPAKPSPVRSRFFFFLVLPDQLFGFRFSSSPRLDARSLCGLELSCTPPPLRFLHTSPWAPRSPCQGGEVRETALSWVPFASRRSLGFASRLESLKPLAGGEERVLGGGGGRTGLCELSPHL